MTADVLDTYLRKNAVEELSNYARAEYLLRDGRCFWFKRAEARSFELVYEVGWFKP